MNFLTGHCGEIAKGKQILTKFHAFYKIFAAMVNYFYFLHVVAGTALCLVLPALFQKADFTKH